MNTILHVLQHALGRDEYGRRKHNATEDYRNHFCCGPGSADYDTCVAAVCAGLMGGHEPRAISGGDWIFYVTEQGKRHIEVNGPKPPKISRGRARYLAYLDADSTVTFGEWLKGEAR